MKTVFIRVQGIVQGVGFRPFVKNLADSLDIKGYVVNTSAGVEIKASGQEHVIESFPEKICLMAPQVSHIVSITAETVGTEYFDSFLIRPSERFKDKITLVSPDMALCEKCAAEISLKGERRYNYPFANCTNCGPRYSITESLPYDRPNTAMKIFPMCDPCREEYENPLDRRFHAQPIACAQCGPSIFLNYKGERIEGCEKALKLTARAIGAGEIVAVKGLGGYHLICDAYNGDAVAELRRIKRRGSKPFAVMTKNIETLDKYIKTEGALRDVFIGPVSPIVLLDWKSHPLSPLINPVSSRIGVMRAYTPLHFLLFSYLKTDFIVATSGNLRSEPIAVDEAEAETRLKAFTDVFLHHSRPIFSRVDDSVIARAFSGYTALRRSRGLAPFPVMIKVPGNAPDKAIFAAGANLKSGMAFYKNGFAFLSQYIGDLDNVETENFYKETFSKMKSLFGIEPEEAVRDMHPSYRSSVFAESLGIKTEEVQHHAAHFASCLCENSHYGDAVGIIFDGFGLGADKKSGWGGEFFVKKGNVVIREASLKETPQPGMDSAARQPCRMAVSYINSAGLLENYRGYLVKELSMKDKEVDLIKNMADKNINTIITTSAGRLFEAAGSLILKKRSNDYEGELAVNLESVIDPSVSGRYSFVYDNRRMDPSPVFREMLADLEKGAPSSEMAAKFHNGFALAAAEICLKLAKENDTDTAALSGGVFQNVYLLNKVAEILSSSGLKVLTHKKVPSNDQGVALGQLYYRLLNLDLKF